MTRKDYILLAEALARSRPHPRSHIARDQWLRTVDSLVDALESDNPLFASSRFRSVAETHHSHQYSST